MPKTSQKFARKGLWMFAAEALLAATCASPALADRKKEKTRRRRPRHPDEPLRKNLGLVIDDADRLLVSHGQYNHVLVFSPNHKLEGQFGEGVMNDPADMAIDEENRFL